MARENTRLFNTHPLEDYRKHQICVSFTLEYISQASVPKEIGTCTVLFTERLCLERHFIIFIRIFGKGDQNAARYFMEKYSEKITLREGTNF